MVKSEKQNISLLEVLEVDNIAIVTEQCTNVILRLCLTTKNIDIMYNVL